MSGVDVIGELLRANPEITELVPVDRIKAGKLDDGVTLPALLVRSISLIDRQTLKRGAVVRSVERVAVTVRAGSYREQRAIIKLVRRCCAGKIGDIADVQSASVLTAGLGPDVAGPASSFEQTQDFRASYDAAA